MLISNDYPRYAIRIPAGSINAYTLKYWRSIIVSADHRDPPDQAVTTRHWRHHRDDVIAKSRIIDADAAGRRRYCLRNRRLDRNIARPAAEKLSLEAVSYGEYAGLLRRIGALAGAYLGGDGVFCARHAAAGAITTAAMIFRPMQMMARWPPDVHRDASSTAIRMPTFDDENRCYD